jgi:hypothetical protein
MKQHLTIAVAGDVHGHLTLLYRVLRRFEQEEGEEIDLVLQVGDLGAFPPPFRLDRATARFAEKDPDELGFASYYAGEGEAEEVFGPYAEEARRFGADLWFIRGNHEDFVFLDETAGKSREPVPVDANGKILYLASGAVGELRRGDLSLRVAGLGGIRAESGPARVSGTEHYSREEVRRLSRVGAVDIFLSHEPPLGAARSLHPRYEEAGSPEVAAYLRENPPAYHFCGHYHEPGGALVASPPTKSFELNAVNFWKPHRLNPRCLGILRWTSAQRSSFSFLEAPWLAEYNKSNYRLL